MLRPATAGLRRASAQAAEIVGVCRGGVFPLVSPATRLPREITDFLALPSVAKMFFSLNRHQIIPAKEGERRLRPLTLLESDEKKVERFRSMLKEFAVKTQNRLDYAPENLFHIRHVHD